MKSSTADRCHVPHRWLISYFVSFVKMRVYMKRVEVVAAVLIHNGLVFACQRGYGEFKDGWEFPGGKVESGESPEEALRREIRE